jgi:hypothetical protein
MMTDESKAEDMSFSWSETVDIEACNHWIWAIYSRPLLYCRFRYTMALIMSPSKITQVYVMQISMQCFNYSTRPYCNIPSCSAKVQRVKSMGGGGGGGR